MWWIVDWTVDTSPKNDIIPFL